MSDVMRASVVVCLLLFASSAHAKTLSVPFKTRNGLVVIRCSTDRGERECVIDTGSSGTIIDKRAVRGALLGSDSIGGLAGPIDMQVREASIWIAGVEIKSLVRVTDLRSRIGEDVLLGEDVFKQFDLVAIDYKHRVVIFQK
jgi:hypothetical protein